MATDYVCKRGTNEKVITKQEVLALYPDAFVSEDDEYEGKTQQTVDVDLGITENGHTAWLAFIDGVVVGAATFGRNHSDALSMLASCTGVDFIDEYNDDYPYYSFPVDVKTATPVAVKDGWQVFQDGGRVVLYNKTTNSFYPHINCSADKYDIDEMIAEAE